MARQVSSIPTLRALEVPYRFSANPADILLNRTRPKEHKEWCPFDTHEKLAVFRTFNKETFRFDYHGHPVSLPLLHGSPRAPLILILVCT